MNKIFSNKFFYLYSLHFLNDGFEGSYLLLLPFIAQDLHINLAQVGFIGALESGVEIFLALPAGYLAKKYGGFRTLIYAMCIYSLGFFAIGTTNSFIMLICIYLIAGAGYGVFNSIGQAIAAKSSHESKRGIQMGTYSSMGDLGKIGIASLLPFFIGYIGWKPSAFLYGSVGLAMFFLFFRTIKNIHKEEIKQNKVADISLIALLKNKQLLLANITNLVDSTAGTALFIFLPFLFIQKQFGLSIGILMGSHFIGRFLGKTILGNAMDTIGNAKTLIISEIGMAISIIFIARENNFLIVLIISFILGIFTRGTVPLIKTMVSDAAKHHGNFEKAFGVNQIFASIAGTVSPALWGFVAYKFGIVGAFYMSATITLFAIIPAVLFSRSRH